MRGGVGIIYCAINFYEWKIRYLLRSTCLSLNLKVLILEERTSSVGSAFQIMTTRLEKKNFRMLFFARGTVNLNGWPRRLVFGIRVKKLSKLRQVLCLTMWSIERDQQSSMTSQTPRPFHYSQTICKRHQLVQLFFKHIPKQPPKPTQHNPTMVLHLAAQNISFQMQYSPHRTPPNKQHISHRQYRHKHRWTLHWFGHHHWL